jgi:hypothetical protein
MMTEMQARMDDGSVVEVSRGVKSGMWGITVTPPSIGATGMELTDEQMRTVLRLSNAVLGNEDDRLELFRRMEYLEGENDEIREENDRMSNEIDAMRSVEDHQFADVYFTLRQQLGIDPPLCNAAVVDTVQRLMDDLSAARDALSDLADLKVHKAKNGADEKYRVLKPKVWARAFGVLGRGKEIELGELKEKVELPPDPSLVQEEAYKSVVRTMERHKKIRDEVDAVLLDMGTTPSCKREWIEDALKRIRDLADGRVLLYGKDVPPIPEEFESSDVARKLYEHMMRCRAWAFRDVKARFAAIVETASREIDIIGDAGRKDHADNCILATLKRINDIARGFVKVEPESK